VNTKSNSPEIKIPKVVSSNKMVAFSKRATYKAKPSGFSLLELLCVISIITVLSVITFQSLRGLSGLQSTNQIIDRLTGSLEQARSEAITQKTYVRVLLSVDSTQNKSRILLLSVASVDGTALDSSEWEDNTKTKLVSKPVWFEHVGLDSTLGAKTDVDISEGSLEATNRVVTGVLQKFTHIIEFNPSGEARVTAEQDRFIKIGIRSSPAQQKNNFVIRLQALTGRTEVLRQEQI
jgi:prepilin-type N-terminal cleavage/methylation domain-containing protein